MPRDTGTFKIKEKVLVPHTDKPYEAKVTKAEKRDNMWFYYIHYPGWNRQYDEWVEATGLMKFEQGPADVRATSVQPEASADVTDAMSEEMQPETSMAPVTHAKAQKPVQHQAPRPALQAADKPPKKRAKKAENTTPVANWDSDQSSQMEFELPVRLKQILLAEYDSFANQHHHQHSLPHRPSVAEILSQYVDQSNSEGLDLEQEVAAGLQTYFDKSLQHMLLYQEEEQSSQQNDILEGTLPSSLYGGNHLLRLLVKLPELLHLHSLSASNQNKLQAGLVDFIVFLEDNASSLFETQ